eukprot:gene21722-37840_t
MGCADCECVVRRTLREGEGAEEEGRKRVLIPFYFIVAVGDFITI